MKNIPITCKSDKLLPISQLENFQGKLKAIDEESFNKLKESIIKYGFSFPIFVWGKKILDGHQRLAAVKRLIDDGYKVKGDKLPIVDIIAKSEQEAAEKLLLINSRYAKILQDGFDLFVADFDINLADFSALLDIPEIIFGDTGEIDYNKEWDGMPEFDQGDDTPLRSIIIHFYSHEDVKKFCKLIGQQVTDKTKYLYYPKREREDKKSMSYESDVSES